MNPENNDQGLKAFGDNEVNVKITSYDLLSLLVYIDAKIMEEMGQGHLNSDEIPSLREIMEIRNKLGKQYTDNQ